jgi:hypothetical protein
MCRICCHTSAVLRCSGWWSWACAHTWAASRCPMQANGTAGSALAMAGKFGTVLCTHLLHLTMRIFIVNGQAHRIWMVDVTFSDLQPL